MYMDKGFEILQEIRQEDEGIACFTTANNPYNQWFFLVPQGVEKERLNISGCIEETLHRLIDNDYTDDEIYFVLGTKRVDTLEEADDEEVTYIDLDYVIPDLLMTVDLM